MEQGGRGLNDWQTWLDFQKVTLGPNSTSFSLTFEVYGLDVSGDCEQKGRSLVGCTLPGSPLTCQKAWKSPITHLYLYSTSFSHSILSASHGTSVRKPPGVIMLINKKLFFPSSLWNPSSPARAQTRIARTGST